MLHSDKLTRDSTQRFRWKVLQFPPYSPDLSPSNFQLLSPLKQHLRCRQFADDDDVKHEVLLWMRWQPKKCYAAEIGALIKR
ncbi:mariner Mos1 transposase [Trichonephila clavipes]|nr:mariner Mos1 transposase [Trichonephila clavipes]